MEPPDQLEREPLHEPRLEEERKRNKDHRHGEPPRSEVSSRLAPRPYRLKREVGKRQSPTGPGRVADRHLVKQAGNSEDRRRRPRRTKKADQRANEQPPIHFDEREVPSAPPKLFE